MKDVMQYTEWSDNIVRRLFSNDKDFPAIKIGKKYQVELNAFKQYLSTRRTSTKNANKDE